jgi:hypothetical protein
VPTRVQPVADATPLGTNNIKVDGVDPRPDDNAGGLRRNIVVHGAGPGMPGCIALDNMVPAPGSSGAVGSRTASAGFPQLDVPGCQLEEGGGQRGAGMFASCSHKKVAARGASHSRSGYAYDSG